MSDPNNSSTAALVAPLKRATGCKVCAQPTAVVQAVNAAIWNADRVRVWGYRDRALKVLKAEVNVDIDVRTIARHADHTELTWRVATEGKPANGNEKPVFPLDFNSYVDRMATLGHSAADHLEVQINEGMVEPEVLVSVMKVGAQAVAARRKSEDTQRGNSAPISVAIFGVVSGHLETPAGEVKDVTPVEELMDAFTEERLLLEARARGESDDEQEEA